MEPDYKLCDKCKEHTSLSIVLCTDRRMDAAGSMENITHKIDLCHECMCNALKYSLRKLMNDYYLHKQLLEWCQIRK